MGLKIHFKHSGPKKYVVLECINVHGADTCHLPYAISASGQA